MPLRIVMMGTGAFALPTFQGLYATAHDIVGLVTQPDRTGRGHHRHVNPLKQCAIDHATDVFQPENVNTTASLARLRQFDADLFVVAAYGQILSAELLGIPQLGAFNLHGSLLPLYRGAAPIQYSIWKGERETGVTIFRIEPKLDAGPILGMVRTPIGPQETSGEVHDRLAELAVSLTCEVIDQLQAGTVTEIPQPTEGVTKAPRISKEQGEIDWSQTSAEIDRHIRAMQPWPKPFTTLHQPDHAPLKLIILAVAPTQSEVPNDAPPGRVLTAERDQLVVKTGDAAVRIVLLQPPGKRAMTADDFLNGHAMRPGDRLGR